jgi:hypothetical protein
VQVEKHDLRNLLAGLAIPQEMEREAEHHRLVSANEAREVTVDLMRPNVACPGWFTHVCDRPLSDLYEGELREDAENEKGRVLSFGGPRPSDVLRQQWRLPDDSWSTCRRSSCNNHPLVRVVACWQT